MENAGRNQPAASRLESVGFAEIENTVVAFIPALQTAVDIGLGCARLQAEKCIREVIANRIELRREVVRLRLALLANERGLGVVLMHVMRDGAKVVEELAVHRPALIALPNGRPHESRPFEVDGFLECEDPFPLGNYVTQSLVRGSAGVGGRRRRPKPALVDAASMASQRIKVLRCQLNPLTRHKKRPRHPCGRQTQNAGGSFQDLPHQKRFGFLRRRHRFLGSCRRRLGFLDFFLGEMSFLRHANGLLQLVRIRPSRAICGAFYCI